MGGSADPSLHLPIRVWAPLTTCGGHPGTPLFQLVRGRTRARQREVTPLTANPPWVGAAGPKAPPAPRERRARRPYPLPEGFEAALTPAGGEVASGTLLKRPSLPSGGEEIGRFFCADGGSGGAWETSMVVPPGKGAGSEGASAPSRRSLLRCSVGASGLHPTPIRCSAGLPRSEHNGHLGRTAEHPAALWSGAPHLKQRPDLSTPLVHRCPRCPASRHR